MLWFRKHRKMTVIIVATLLVLTVGAGTLYALLRLHGKTMEPAETTTSSTAQNNSTPPPQDSVVKVVAMGDMLAHDTITANAKTGDGYDFAPYFSDIRSSYKDADVVFCNQEGLSAGDAFGISGYPSFNAPTSFSTGLQKGAGCNAINLANNHMGDKGVAATNATLDNWASLQPLLISGANKSLDDQNNDVSYATVKGIRFALVSFADFNNNRATPPYSVNIYHDQNLLERLVKSARENADIVMVSMHWGTEDSSVVNADQSAQVTLLASLGVDVILGTGPHVLQKVETVSRPDGGSMLVWYSLGNLLSSQLNVDELIGGIAGFDVTKSASDGKLSINNVRFIPTYMHYEWTGQEAAAGDLLARKNAHIYLLKDAAAPLARSLLNTSVASQEEYVSSTLGPTVTIEK